MTPDTLYIVVTEFPTLGIGSAGDATTSRSEAYDQFAEAVSNSQPTRAFRLDFDVETGALESATEITADLGDELQRCCTARGLEMPEVA